MNKINKSIDNIFKWDVNSMLKAIFGTFLFAFAMNIFIVPTGLYTGGILGISQLIRTFLEEVVHLSFRIDIASILNYLINIPLLILAYRMVSKTFFSRTLFCISMMTLFMILIPTIEVPLINDLLTSTLIGGVLAGYGSGTILSSGGSGGGTDIIGIIVSMKNRNLSVGKLGLIINICIYSICGVFFGIPTMIYSILSSIFSTIMVDRRHDQNVCSMAFIFTKNEPSKLIKFIREELSRDSTYWEGVGGYQNTTTYITYTSLSRYELQRLERHLTEIDKTAFLVKNDGVGIKGNFKKYL